MPDKPSKRLKTPVSADLEELIMRCLAKEPSARPASARELEEALGRCASAGQWDRAEAEDWWRQFDAAMSERTAVLPKAALAHT
jgi:serine/threonine-protein kinase